LRRARRPSTIVGMTHERRGSPRVEVDLGCRLSRAAGGSSISARTIDVGPGGMRIATDRPLRVDEVLDFLLSPETPSPVVGQARVMREQTYQVYAVRFERLPAGEEHHLRLLTDRAQSAPRDAGGRTSL
jgi:hypothetical protein